MSTSSWMEMYPWVTPTSQLDHSLQESVGSATRRMLGQVKMESGLHDLALHSASISQTISAPHPFTVGDKPQVSNFKVQQFQ